MSRLHARDSEALASLYYRYSRIVLAIGSRVLHDRGEAEEIVQDVFFQVFQKASLFDPSKGSAKTWIVQIAFHRALDRKAYLDRRGFYVNEEISYLGDSLAGRTDLDQEIGAKLKRVQLEKAFEELPEMQRRTLELFYFEGMNLCDMIEELNEIGPTKVFNFGTELGTLKVGREADITICQVQDGRFEFAAGGTKRVGKQNLVNKAVVRRGKLYVNQL